MLGSIYTLGLSLFGIIYPYIDDFLYLRIYRSNQFKPQDKLFFLIFSVLLTLFLTQNTSIFLLRFIGAI